MGKYSMEELDISKQERDGSALCPRFSDRTNERLENSIKKMRLELRTQKNLHYGLMELEQRMSEMNEVRKMKGIGSYEASSHDADSDVDQIISAVASNDSSSSSSEISMIAAKILEEEKREKSNTTNAERTARDKDDDQDEEGKKLKEEVIILDDYYIDEDNEVRYLYDSIRSDTGKSERGDGAKKATHDISKQVSNDGNDYDTIEDDDDCDVVEDDSYADSDDCENDDADSLPDSDCSSDDENADYYDDYEGDCDEKVKGKKISSNRNGKCDDDDDDGGGDGDHDNEEKQQQHLQRLVADYKNSYAEYQNSSADEEDADSLSDDEDTILDIDGDWVHDYFKDDYYDEAPFQKCIHFLTVEQQVEDIMENEIQRQLDEELAALLQQQMDAEYEDEMESYLQDQVLQFENLPQLDKQKSYFLAEDDEGDDDGSDDDTQSSSYIKRVNKKGDGLISHLLKQQDDFDFQHQIFVGVHNMMTQDSGSSNSSINKLQLSNKKINSKRRQQPEDATLVSASRSEVTGTTATTIPLTSVGSTMSSGSLESSSSLSYTPLLSTGNSTGLSSLKDDNELKHAVTTVTTVNFFPPTVADINKKIQEIIDTYADSVLESDQPDISPLAENAILDPEELGVEIQGHLDTFSQTFKLSL